MKKALVVLAVVLFASAARAQGKFDAMDDALFANQRERLPVQEVARRVGLDLDRFGACLDAPETTLEIEIPAGASPAAVRRFTKSDSPSSPSRETSSTWLSPVTT